MTTELVPLPERPAGWDKLISSYPGKTLFHESVWLDHLAAIRDSARIQYYEIRAEGKLVGVLSSVRDRRAMVSIMGSPLPGTGTMYMGPLVTDTSRLPDVLRAIFAQCRNERIMQLELAHPFLDEYDPASLGLEAHPSVTRVLSLPETEGAAWQTLHSKCRNQIRKAQKGGLVCEVTADRAIVDHLIRMYQEVFAKQGLALPVRRGTIESLFDHLVPADRVLPVWVRHEGEIIAAGLFPFDGQTIYFWGAASWLRCQHLCPNDLLHWTVIQQAIARGVRAYNMGGSTHFKQKFGGADIPYIRYSASFAAWLRPARAMYQGWYHAQLRARGLLRKRPRLPVSVGPTTHRSIPMTLWQDSA